MTNDEPKRRGKARSGKPRNRMLPFSVTPEDEEWLLTLPNRSEWLRKCIETERKRSPHGTKTGSPTSPPHQDAE